MNNTVFGKTMENIRNRVDMRLVNDRKITLKLAAKRNFKHRSIFNKDLAIHVKKTKLNFDTPVYCGMSIIDITKTLVYDFYFSYIMKKYGDCVKLLLADTDSLMYEVETEELYKNTSSDVEDTFDTSKYPHVSGIPSGKIRRSWE